MDVSGALGLGARELVAFVGAGGKKTAMAHLVEQGRGSRRVAYTTTTHMPPPDLELVVGGPETVETAFGSRLSADHPLAVASERVTDPERVDEKVRGFPPETVDALFETGTVDWMLVKADGARMRGFKAPDVDEPALPGRSTVVVPVASVQAVGQVLSEETVHRPERVGAIASISIGDVITPAVVGRVLASDSGGCKDVPDGARVLPMVNKADSAADRETAREILRAAFDRTDRFDRGLVTSFEAESVSVVTD